MNFGELKAATTIIAPTVPDLGKQINRALIDLAKDSKKIRRSEEAVAAGTGVVTLPADCLAIKAVAYEGRPLDQYAGLTSPPDEGPGGNFLYWVPGEGEIKIYPPPSEDKTAELAYTPRPAVLVDDADEPDLDGADDAIVAFAKWKLFAAREDWAAANYWRDEYAFEKTTWLSLDEKQNKQVRRVQVGSFT